MVLIGHPLTAMWLWDASDGNYDNNTIEAHLENGVSFELMRASGDRAYFGFSRRFDAIMYMLDTSGKYVGLKWEYGATASSWIEFVPIRDDLFGGGESGYMRWDVRGSTIDTAWDSIALTNPGTHPQDPPDTVARFWIRASATTITTTAAVDSVISRPYVTYATPADVQNQLQLSVPFNNTTSVPSLFQVEDLIRGAEDWMIYQMGRSWRVDWVEEELVNFNQYGMKLRREDVIEINELAVYDGSKFTPKVIGRGQDFHFEPLTGIIYVSTIFLDAMPPNFRRSYTKRREMGAFKRAVRVSYSWGKDIRQDMLGAQVGRIATKQACIDVVTDLDFTPLIPLGLDTINLQQKVDGWTNDVNEFIDRYGKLRMA